MQLASNIDAELYVIYGLVREHTQCKYMHGSMHVGGACFMMRLLIYYDWLAKVNNCQI
jgi:hypothetical protein